MTKENWKNFYEETDCYACRQDLVKRNERDEVDVWNTHTGNYSGKAHRYKQSPYNDEKTKYTCYNLHMRRFYHDDEGNRVEVVCNKRKTQTKDEVDGEIDRCIHCDGPLMQKMFTDKVRHYCPITGEYRGAVHSACGFKLKLRPQSMKIPVIAHNLKNCDMHLLMREIGKLEGKLSCIPNNMERYMTFGWGNLRFIDSYQNLASALSKLVENGQGALGVWCPFTGKYLAKAHREVGSAPTNKEKSCHEVITRRPKRGKEVGKEYEEGKCVECEKELSKDQGFEITRSCYSGEELQALLMRKGVYPYEYMDSFERFEETGLPEKRAFYSTLTRDGITDEDYETRRGSGAGSGTKAWGITTTHISKAT